MSQAYYKLQHEQLEQLVVKLIEKVEEISKLSLGPEADSSYFINFTVHFFPQFWNKLEKIELKGIEVSVTANEFAIIARSAKSASLS